MAEVFLAKAEGPRRAETTVVIKRILPHVAEDPELAGAFLSGARLAARLNHPNIVRILDFGLINGACFIAMEHVDGPNLRALSNRVEEMRLRRAVPFALCARIVALACEGLAYAHGLVDAGTGEPLSLVHGDLGPDNIMLTSAGGVKVAGLGVARAAKGKVMYMPPEQLHDKPLDRRADVYALGVVLYNLATASTPYEADSDLSLRHAILLQSPVKARERRRDLPEKLDRIIDRAMQKDLEGRYQSCFEMQDDLEQYLSHCGVPAGSGQIADLVRQAAKEAA